MLQELSRINPWWSEHGWEMRDAQLQAAAAAPFRHRPQTLDDIAPPNLYTIRGPRRVGKSTLLKQTVVRLISRGTDPRRICYFSADSIDSPRDLINMFQAARQLFPDLGQSPRYFLVDEVTTIQDWQRGVKWIRDNTPAAADCLVVSGSSASDIAGGAVHLAGRRGSAVGLDRLLLPMSFPEFVTCAGYGLPTPPRLSLDAFYRKEGREACHDALAHVGTLIDAFEAYLLVGGFPQAVSEFRRTATVPAWFFRDLWDVVVSDLRRQGVSRPEQCLGLLEQLSASVSSPISIQTIATNLAVDRRTASAWIDALANSYLLVLLFKERGGVPDVKSLRKVYPADPVVARLASWHSPGAGEPDLPKLAESALALAIFRSVEANAVERFHRPDHLFYYRSPSGAEIDFLVSPSRRVAESKYIDTADRRELRAMLANFGEGLLLTRSAVDIQAPGTILPAAVFAWLLDQGT